MRPRVLAVLPHVIPSTVLTVLKPLTALHRAGHLSAEFELEDLASRRQVESADVVVFSRNTDSAYGTVLRSAVELGKPIVYDLDDNFFVMPSYSTTEQNYATPQRLAQLQCYLRSASLVRLYSEHLQRRTVQMNPNAVTVAAPLDWSLVPSRVSRDPDYVSIVYATARVGDQLANLFLDDIERLLAAYPGRVNLTLWGCRLERLARHPYVRFLSPIRDYDHFFARFARVGFDIGLAPLPADDFHLGKSNNKFREYAACRIAGVYSDVEVYSPCVQHGVTGLRVPNTPGAWFDAVKRLIDDASLRSNIQSAAYAYAREHYGQDKFCAEWLTQITALLESPRPLLPADAIAPSESAAGRSPLTLVSHSVRLARRFARSVRAAGLGESLSRARWALNDLSIISWKRALHG